MTGAQQGGFGASIGCQYGCGNNWMAARLFEASRLGYSFPWASHDADRGLSLLSLHSVADETDTVGKNAIGFVDDTQLDRLKTALETLPSTTRTVVLTLHHPLFVPKADWPGVSASDLLQPIVTAKEVYTGDWFMSIFLDNNVVQARKLFDMLQKFSEEPEHREVVVLYGHRHRRNLSRIGDVTLVEAPNVGTDYAADLGLFAITRDEGKPLRVHWCPASAQLAAVSP